MKSMFKNIKKKFSSKDKADGKTATSSKDAKGGVDDGNSTVVYTKEDLLTHNVKLVGCAADQRTALFVTKVRLCCVMFEWEPVDDLEMPAPRKDNPEEAQARETKREILLELVDYINKNRSFITEAVFIEMLKMIATNIFRTLPSNYSDIKEDDDEPVFEPSWPHLQIVYEFFLRFLISNDLDMKTLKKHINGLFVLHLLELFHTEDPRERDYLKTILHRIYAKFMSLRAYIRRCINHSFYNFIYESGQFNGAAELLEILGSIINGFALPLKQEHKTFLQRVLIPMHKVKPIAAFHQQLSYCMTQFVNKDPKLAVVTINGLIKFWPVTNSQKEVLFLNELEEVLQITQADEFKTVMVPLFKLLCRSIGSPHFQVAERALFLWHDEYISAVIADHRDVILPIIFPVLHVNSQHHWNQTVTSLTLNVLKIFVDMDSELVDECTHRYTEQQREQEIVRQQRDDVWNRLSDTAQKSQ